MGRDVTGLSPRRMNEAGVGYVPGDRHRFGLILSFPVYDNLVLTSYYRPPFARGLLRNDSAILESAAAQVERFDIRTPSARARTSTLSGGNQQKVVVAREFDRELKLLILDQPTRGLDVGSIEFIHRQIIAKRDAGTAVLLVSAELDEILEMSDRIVVMYRGRMVAELDGRTADKSEVGLLMATGGQDGAGRPEGGTGVSGPANERHARPGLRTRIANAIVASIQPIAEPLVAIVLALLVGAVGITMFSGLLAGHSNFDVGLPVAAYLALLEGVASPNGFTSTLVYATPLILAGLGVGLGFKAGLFNIGGRGQFLFGTVGAMAVASTVGVTQSSYITIPLALLAGALFGAAAGFIPGFLKATSGAHEVVTTIMLNYVFVFVTYWAISGPLVLPNAHQPITADVTDRNAALPIILGRDGNAGILLALAAVPIIWFLLYRTTLGFEIRSAGANADAARYGGMKTEPVDRPDDVDRRPDVPAWPARRRCWAWSIRSRPATTRRSASMP